MKKIRIEKDGNNIINSHLVAVKDDAFRIEPIGAKRFDIDYYLIANGKKVGDVFDIQEHSEWGSSINISDWSKQKYDGHGFFQNDAHTYLCSEMGSGKIALIKLTSIKRMNDPIDQFFADGKLLGYIKIKEKK